MTDKNLNLSLRQKFLWLGAVSAFWVFLALISSLQMAFTGPFTWVQTLHFACRDWFPWMVLSPLVLWVAWCFPLESGRWRWNIPIHCLACAGAVLACEHLSQWVELRMEPGPSQGGSDRRAPWDRPRGPDRFGGSSNPTEGPRERPPGPPPQDGPPRPRGRRGPGPLFRAQLNIPIYFFVVSMSHAFRYFRRSRERERRALELEASLAQAKLQSLRMQLNPHFLFNTLNAISTLVHRDPVGADETIVNLSELLRMSMEDSDQQEIPLRRELEFLDRYLEIQQVRFGERLRVEKEVDPGVLVAQVPVMILQPLVENAIKHGIEPQTGLGLLKIAARHTGDLLQVTIGDNGPGLPGAGGTAFREGIGLANTRARLRELYGPRHQFTLSNAPAGGLLVFLEIPYHEQPASFRPD